ncbi:MAG TPA: acetylxylan esterase, partial [Aggregatilineaceae bacterium]|nr:acetylxylan esterase [Aggregatilineaceae bacterium]
MAHDPTMRRAELLSLLGDLPPLDRPIRAERLWRETRPHYHLEKWTLDLNGLEPVPAYVTLPLDARGPAPAVLYNHAHGSDYALGKDELLNGRSHLQAPPYAEALAREGVAALCIDHWVFGERATRTESAAFKQMLWEGRVLWGMMVYDSLRAIDFLVERPEVDPARIGTLGLSMGSTMAWWVAALDTRVQVCVDLCCLTDYQALIDAGGLDGHGVYYYVPRLLKHFTSAEINAL